MSCTTSVYDQFFYKFWKQQQQNCLRNLATQNYFDLVYNQKKRLCSKFKGKQLSKQGEFTFQNYICTTSVNDYFLYKFYKQSQQNCKSLWHKITWIWYALGNKWAKIALDHSLKFLRLPYPYFLSLSKNLQEFLYVCTVQVAPIHHIYWQIKISQTIFEKGYSRNISMKLLSILSMGYIIQNFKQNRQFLCNVTHTL